MSMLSKSWNGLGNLFVVRRDSDSRTIWASYELLTGIQIMSKLKPVEVARAKSFYKSQSKLAKKANSNPVARKALEQAEAILFRFKHGQKQEKSLTNHGESRIPNAVKFDLGGAYRLVLQKPEPGVIAALFVGNHDDTDRWLNKNKNKKHVIVIEDSKPHILVAQVSSSADEATDALKTAESDSFELRFDEIGDERLLRLNLEQDFVEHIGSMLEASDADGEEIAKQMRFMAFPSEECKCAVLDAIIDLIKGEFEQARNRLDLEYARMTGKLDESPNAFINALRQGAGGVDLVLDGQLDVDELEHIVKTENFEDWLLFLHPDQRFIVDKEFKGPARLMGVAGSGKTCVLVHRAVRLAKTYPNEKILILSYNRALSHLLEYLLTARCEPETRKQIEVMSVGAYLRNIVEVIDPGEAKKMNEKDHKSGEDTEACWSDFCDKDHGLPSIQWLVDAIESYGERPPNAAAYLYDELCWIRSGFSIGGRKDYLNADRRGRGVPLPRGDEDETMKSPFPPETRQEILRLLDDFEEYMEAGHLIDREGVTQTAYRYRDQIENTPDIRYRCVLVDEYQDLSTLELSILRRVPTEKENGVYFVGDPLQKIFPRHHDHGRINLSFTGRSDLLTKNFRNTKRILETAQHFILPFVDGSTDSKAPISADEITSPEYAVERGETPHIFAVRDSTEQLKLCCSFIHMMDEYEWQSVAIVSHDKRTLQAVAHVLELKKIPHQRLGPGVDYRQGGVKLADLDDVKGFEFSTVIMLDMSDPKRPEREGFPSESVPWVERWRDAMRLYVAMTRARDYLFMSYIDDPSVLLRGVWDSVVTDDEAESVEKWYSDLDKSWVKTINLAVANVAAKPRRRRRAGSPNPPPHSA